MSSWKELLRSWLPAPRRTGKARRPRLGLEALEVRDTPAITATGTPPSFQSIGPVAIANSANIILGTPDKNIQVGAVNEIALDPFDATHLVVASVNGGIWSSNNYPNANLTYTTTTDALPSLSISSIAFSPLVRNTIYAGTGSFTAGGLGPNFAAGVTNPGDGGASVGLYKSTDGGQTWIVQGTTTFTGLRIRDVVPTRLNGGNTVFVDTTDGGTGKQGVYRSDDGGVTWTRLSGANGLPDLGVTNLIADAVNPNKFYAVPVGGAGAGVYLLDLTVPTNRTWQNITNNLPPAAAAGSRILLASSPVLADATNPISNPIFAAVVDPTGIPQGVYRAIPFTGGNPPAPVYVWTKIGPQPNGLPPDVSRGQQGDVHFAIAADPVSPNLVYVAGDRKDLFPYAGNVARGDAIADTWTTITVPDNPPSSPTPGTTTPLVPTPAPTTAPHPDFRGLTFVNNNTIIASTDGGVYQVVNPRGGTGAGGAPAWSSVNGNLVITEVYQADVDDRNTASIADDVYMAGAQDNGESESVGGTSWSEIETGDGVVVRADDVNRYRYYSSQNFGISRRNPDGTINSVFDNPPTLSTAVTGGGFLAGNTPFNPVFTLNQADTNLILVGGNFQDLYLSRDHANTFDSIGGPGLGTPVPNLTGTVTATAFGTTQVRFAAYAATDDGEISQSFDITSGRGNFVKTNFKSVAGGEAAYNIVMDPNNPLSAYAVTPTRVFRTTDAKTWTDITGTLSAQVAGGGFTKLYALTYFNNGTSTPADDVLLVGGYGGVFATRVAQLPANGGPGTWLKFGDGIPNVVVSDLRYDAVADTLIAATYGRSAFRLVGASAALLGGGPVVTITGNASANNIAVFVDPTDPTKFRVTDGLGNAQSFSLNAYRNVVLRGLGGGDTITIGAPAPGTAGSTVPLALNITVDGGGDVGDILVIQDATDTTGRTATLTATTLGGVLGDTLFSNGGSVNYTGFNAGGVQLRFGSGNDSLKYDDSATTGAVTYGVTAGRLTRSAGGVYDYSGVNRLTFTGGSGASTINVQSTPGPTTIDGGLGDDTINVASDAPANAGDLGTLAGALTLAGGGGSDTARVNGTSGADSVAVRLTTGSADGTLTGLPQPLTFTSLETLAYDGRGGANDISISDESGRTFGSPTDLTSGIIYTPTGAGAGVVRLGQVMQVVVSGITTSGLTVSGDGDGSGDRDTLLLLGTSAPGRQSAFGEAVIGDGRDTISVSDGQFSIQTASGVDLLGLTPGFTNGQPSFATIYLAAGNEAGNDGDTITASPSGVVNLVIDGGDPVAAPGDRLTVLGSGPFTVTQIDDSTFGPAQNQVVDTSTGYTLGYTRIERTNLGSAGSSVSGLIAVASDVGPETTVQVYDRLTGAFRYQVTPFPGFTGGATVASGDVTGDGIADLVVGAGPGGGPRVAIFSGVDGALLADFFGYEPEFRGGVNVATADINKDGFSDLILGTGVGGGPRVRILSGKDFSVIRDVFAYDSRFRGGVNVAAGDYNADGTPDLVTSTGSGGGPQVVVLSGIDLRPIASFFVFDPDSRAGFYAAAADVNGDGYADVIAGGGVGDPGRVRVYSGLTRGLLADFYVTDPAQQGFEFPSIPFDSGIRVAAADLNGDGIDDVITAKGPGSTPTIRGYQIGTVNPTTKSLELNFQEIRHQDVFDGFFNAGIYVGASN